MEISTKKKPIKVLVYSDTLDPQVANKIRKFPSTSIEVQEVFSLTDIFLVNDVDVIVIESGAYQHVMNDIKLCNKSLQDVPVLAVIYFAEPPLDTSINYVMIDEATSNVLVQMIYMLHRENRNTAPKEEQNTNNVHNIDKDKVAKDLADIQRKYMPELIRIRDELATNRNTG